MNERRPLLDFVLGLGWPDAPGAVRSRLSLLLRDFLAVSLAGRATPTACIAADYAETQHSGAEATALLDGRRLTATGAAWANGVLANALDFDDGHRLTKGHPGANVVPAALAIAEGAGAALEELLGAILVGYEVAVRAGIELHARSPEYHASGAWGAVGAASAGARLLRLDPARTAHALGLAEYHAPVAPVMRSVADPAMTKDACGYGAQLGVFSALLAERGFTATRSRLLEASDVWADLGERWHVLDVYVKRFPCCRWSHPAIEAALGLRSILGADSSAIARVVVRTFSAAAALSRAHPTTTEMAQYSLAWPVAAALAHADFGVRHILADAFEDPAARCIEGLVEIDVAPAFDAAFPARRLSEVTIELTDGSSHRSGPTEAPGEADDPGFAAIVERKFDLFAAGVTPTHADRESTLAGRPLDELLGLLAADSHQLRDRSAVREG